MLKQIWSTAPVRKVTTFDVEQHLKKEEFLRSQLLKEKNLSKEAVQRIEKQNNDIKLHARLVVAGLQEKVHLLEEENQKIRDDQNVELIEIQKTIERLLEQQRDEGKLTQANLTAKAEELLAISKQLSTNVYKRHSPFKRSNEIVRSPIPAHSNGDINQCHDSPYLIPTEIFNTLQNDRTTDGTHTNVAVGETSKVRDIVKSIENAKVKKNLTIQMINLNDDMESENSPIRNNCSSPTKKFCEEGKKKMTDKTNIPITAKKAKRNPMNEKGEFDSSNIRVLDDGLREKDNQIDFLQDELHNATSKILQLEEELSYFRTAKTQFETPQAPVIVSLNELIDVKSFQDQIFATCAMTLVFILILSKKFYEENDDSSSTDLSISQVMFAKSHRVLELNEESMFSIEQVNGKNEENSLYMKDFSAMASYDNNGKNTDEERLTNEKEEISSKELIDSQKKSLSLLQQENEQLQLSMQEAIDREAELQKELEIVRRSLDMEKLELEKSKRSVSLHSKEIETLTLQKDELQCLFSNQVKKFSSLSEEMDSLKEDHKEMMERLEGERIVVKNDQFSSTEDLISVQDIGISVEVQQEGVVETEEAGKLRENIASLKKSMKERALQSIEKIKSLQSENEELLKQTGSFKAQLQVFEEERFENQVELQEAKQQVRTLTEDKKKLKEHYKNQMKEYQKQYDLKCREIKKLQELLVSDKQRFKKLKDSMKKIVQLKSCLFEDSSATLASLEESTFSVNSHLDEESAADFSLQSGKSLSFPDPELHKLYIEEIQKRMESKDRKEAELLLSELATIDKELKEFLHHQVANTQKKEDTQLSKGVSFEFETSSMKANLFDRIRELQNALEKKHDDCTTMQEEMILLKSKLHLYEVLNANSVSLVSSPFPMNKSSGFPLSPLLVDDEPMLHSDRKGEIRILRLKVLDLESAILNLQQEKEALRAMVAAPLPADVNAIVQSYAYKQLQNELSIALETVSNLKQMNSEWSKKYDTMKERMEDLTRQEHYYKNELELERRNTLDLLSELRHSPTHSIDTKINDTLGTENFSELRKKLRLFIMRLLTADKMEDVEECTTVLCSMLQMVPQEVALVKGTLLKLGPMIVAYSSFEDANLDISIAIDSLAHSSEVALDHVHGFESY